MIRQRLLDYDISRFFDRTIQLVVEILVLKRVQEYAERLEESAMRGLDLYIQVLNAGRAVIRQMYLVGMSELEFGMLVSTHDQRVQVDFDEPVFRQINAIVECAR